MTADAAPFDDTTRDHLLRVLDYTAGWVTAELLSGLLANRPLYAALAEGTTCDQVVRITGLTPRRAEALLTALEVEAVVASDGAVVELTTFGRSLDALRGWLDLFVRGYGGYFHNAADVWQGRVDDGWRDVGEVGLASVRMSEHDAIPTVLALMDGLGGVGARVVDVGCANGAYLVRLCERRSDLIGVGVERDVALVAEARRHVDARGLGSRISIMHAADGRVPTDAAPDYVIFAFVLQELAGQLGVPETGRLLGDIGGRFPDATVLVVEVDGAGRHDVERLRNSRQRRCYYSPYYLLHDLTEQRLLSFAEWRDLWDDAGFDVVAERAVDPSVDDTGLTVGFALRHRNGLR